MNLVASVIAKNELGERFWPKVAVSGADECWPWQASCDPQGYGQFTIKALRAAPFKAHRVAWALTNGEIRDGLWVLHRCDNPPCCNPSHLFLGTNNDNIADAVSKGRMSSGDSHWMRRSPDPRRAWGGKRQVHGAAKLTKDQVLDIRARRESGETTRALAAAFGTTSSNISEICLRKTWRHV